MTTGSSVMPWFRFSSTSAALASVDGTVYERRLMVGVPVSTAQPASAITAEPGTSAQLLRHAEAVAMRLARAGGALAGE